MGLIGFVIAPVCEGLNAVQIPTLRFIKRPSVWLDTIHRHRGTASFAPNFAYALTMQRVKKFQIAQWDLSCLKVLGCGAEPIRPETMREFVNTFRECGLPETTITAAYGMAEATLAIALTRHGEVFKSNWVDAETFRQTGVAIDLVEGGQALEHVGCGSPFSGHQVVSMNDDGQALPEGREGELCLRGPSNTPGYFRNPEATAETFRNGWLHTGDLGYIKDGEVFITGRLKDLIILNGRNIHPQSIEWCAGEVDGVRAGNIIGFSVPGTTSEKVILCVETRKRDEKREALRKEVKAHVQKQMSVALAEVVMLNPGSLPKTSSGKLQRRKCRQQYLAGRFAAEATPRATAP
jgi:fatty-acyl-CoA synthase